MPLTHAGREKIRRAILLSDDGKCYWVVHPKRFRGMPVQDTEESIMSIMALVAVDWSTL